MPKKIKKTFKLASIIPFSEPLLCLIPPKTKFMKLTCSLTRLITAVLFTLALTINSCKKEVSNDYLSPQEEEQASLDMTESDAEAENAFNDVFDNVMGANNDVGMEGTGVFGRMNNTFSAETARIDSLLRCFTVTITQMTVGSAFPIRIVLDFGNGCLGRDGHTRYGKIITIYTNRLITPGASATTTFEEFRIDSVLVQGTLKISNTSTTTNHQFKVDVEGAKLTHPNGNFSEWNSHKTITQTEGNATVALPFDDIYKVEGEATGKVKRGDRLFAWRTEFVEPLIKKSTCHWIAQGKVRIVRVSSSANSQWVAVLDYGSGNCDNQATITINGVVHQITLH